MVLPEFPVEGGCQCGAVRYRLKASPLTVYNCHCKACQRFSGARSTLMFVRDEDFEVLSGQTVRYDRKADSGNVIAANFCAHCHGLLWSNNPTLPGIKLARAGTLDKMDWAEPVGNTWTDSKAAWVKIDPELVNFPKQAVDRKPLFDAWTRQQRVAQELSAD